MSSLTSKEFEGEVEKILIDQIQPSSHNPRGPVDKNENYQRLVSSIADIGVIVPIVVRTLPHGHGKVKYELVDGERRYWAAKECGRNMIPAHILRGSHALGNLRKLMFHTHMTREQWGALAQCRALAEVYPALDRGLKFSEKQHWVRKLVDDTVMSQLTARDRVHVLSWPKDLKEEIYAFDEREISKDIYSYVLAIEVSVIEQSRQSFQEFYNHGQKLERVANNVRRSLLHKTIAGMQTGVLTSREQIRNITPLFSGDLTGSQKRCAQALFKEFVGKSEFQFDDLRAEIAAKLPETLKQRPPKPQRLVSALRALARTMRDYDIGFIDSGAQREKTRQRIHNELTEALDEIVSAARNLKSKI